MSLHRLSFDATDANSIAASANVGAYLRSSDGTLITHTDVGGKKALDVRVAEGINVEVDLSHVDDSVKIGDGTDLLAVNADGSINAVVTATDLDIRDLSSATDSVTAVQGTSPWVVGDGGGSLTVDAVNLDIRDLAAATDSVSSWTKDGSGNSINSTSNALHVNVQNSLTVSDSALANTAIKALAETVGTSAAQIVDGADELADRKYIFIYNNGNRVGYIGETGVTTSSGYPVSPGAEFAARIGAAVDIFMIADAAGQNFRTLQAA